MPAYKFKLMGSFDERGRKTIEINEDSTIAEVKELVKKEFMMPPSMKVSLLIDGASLSDETKKWVMVSAVPRKTVITVIGTR